MFDNGITRRGALALAGGALAATATGVRFPAAAARAVPGGGPVHGLSVFGALALPADFEHLAYVDPAAPKGGRIALLPSSWQTNQNPLTFNTLNMWVLRGDSPPRLELIFDSLMVRALDEPDAVYGLLAATVEIDPSGRVYTFAIRPEARWHDGVPVTAGDVVFTLTSLKEKGHPLVRAPLEGVAEVVAEEERRVSVRFAEGASNRLPPLIATYPVLPRHWYEGRDFEAAGMDVPLGSGPYRVGRFETGRFIEYERVADWWGRDLPVTRGQNNFDSVRVEFFRDRQIGFQALTDGTVTWREEFTSKTWATEYNFPAVEDGRVVKATFPDERPAGAQGWFINTRREKFADPRTREALGLAFDFEWSNANLFYGAYSQTESFFQNSDMMAEGEPDAAERALLEPFRGTVPEAVFGPVWKAPVSDGSGQDRTLLREANRLLAEAGWQREGRQLVDGAGRPFTVEILSNSPSFERVVQPYVRNLRLLGIDAAFRLVDPAQFQSRVDAFDFDLVGRRFTLSATPSETIREFWTSRAARMEGTNNLSGIADPVVDVLVEAILSAKTREEMVTATRALDRVLRLGHYWVPNWYKPSHTVAYWNLFGMPADKPRYGFPVETTWWFDEALAARTLGG